MMLESIERYVWLGTTTFLYYKENDPFLLNNVSHTARQWILEVIRNRNFTLVFDHRKKYLRYAVIPTIVYLDDIFWLASRSGD